MIVSAPSDYREAARRRLPRFLFDYIDGGAVAENTMNANAAELASVALRQRVLCGAGEPTLATTILDAPWAMPVALGPVGATGMYARRGEVQAARAASRAGIPYTLSTVSVCSIEEVASHASGALWSQLYVLKDRGYMRNALERARAAGMKTWYLPSICQSPARGIAITAQGCPGRTPPCDNISRLAPIRAGR